MEMKADFCDWLTCMTRQEGVGKHDTFFFALLPPKSGLNRMSYPFISLSTVSFTRGMLLGSLISFTLEEERRGEMVITGMNVSDAEIKKINANWNLLLSPHQSHHEGKSQNPKVVFPDPPHVDGFEIFFIYPGVFWMLRGERASNLLQTAQSSQWGGACAEAARDQSVERDDGGWTVSIAEEKR